jgi:hypothetical protein
VSKINSFIEEFVLAEEKKDYTKMRELLLPLEDGAAEVQDYITKMESIQISFVDESVKVVADDSIVNLLSIGLTKDSVKKINKPFSYEECVATCEAVRGITGNYLFLISNEVTLSGKLLGKVRDNKIKIDLANHYTPNSRSEEEEFVLYFGQGNSKFKSDHNLSTEFYSYFFDSENKNYLILSLEPIKTMRVKISGMRVVVSDKMVVGESYNLPSKLTVVFVHSIEEEKRTFTEEEIRGKVGTPSFERLKNMFFGVYMSDPVAQL